jgi:hypothetical protein
LDKRVGRDGRKILLFLDNCSAHPKIKLENIELKFLPPNTTAASQVNLLLINLIISFILAYGSGHHPKSQSSLL